MGGQIGNLEAHMRNLIAIAALACCVTGAAAQDKAASPAPAEPGRYTMTPAPNGFLRLDTQTGAVSLCTVSGASAECRSAADERTALNDEVDRLAKRNADLEKQLADAGKSRSPRAALPSKYDMNTAFDYAEQFLGRMMGAIRADYSNNDRI
jgi:hypothetical protein